MPRGGESSLFGRAGLSSHQQASLSLSSMSWPPQQLDLGSGEAYTTSTTFDMCSIKKGRSSQVVVQQFKITASLFGHDVEAGSEPQE